MLQPSTILDNRFEIERHVASGGMGDVYRGRDRETDAIVAVKLLRSASVNHAGRFAREARVLATIQHPHVVRYLAHGSTENAGLYLAMEWLEGETLDHRLRRSRLTVRESVQLVKCLAEILADLHALGIIHRDVKPSNVFLVGGELDAIRLLDFGIAWHSDHTRLTQTGTFVGSAPYTAPERMAGQREFDPRSDLFALGCVLYECIVGMPALDAANPVALLTRLAFGELPRLRDRAPQLPDELLDLADRMLARDPRRRPSTGTEVAATLSSLSQRSELTSVVEIRDANPPADVSTAPALELMSLVEPSISALILIRADRVDESVRTRWMVAAAPHGGRLEVLDPSTVAVLIGGSQLATDLAARAATCALAIATADVPAFVSLAVGYRDVPRASTDLPLEERATRPLRWPAPDGAPSGCVVIDEATVGLLDGRFDVRQLRDGRFVLAGERASADVRALLGRATPCVGRERELRLLDELFDESVVEMRPCVAVVTAPPGGGKTRLGAELLRRLEGRSRTVWRARAESIAAGAPLGVASQLMRAACGIEAADPVAVRRDKIRETIAAYADGRADRLFPEFVGEIAGASWPDGDADLRLRTARRDIEVMRDHLRSAFVGLVAAVARRGPLLVVLEDLHWSDSASLALLGATLREVTDAPAFMLALARPEFDPMLASLGSLNVHRIWLPPLSRTASEQLVRHVLGPDLPSATIDRIITISEGNAFFLEELIREAASTSDLSRLPLTAIAMMQSRMAALDDHCRHLLRAASVFGDTFWASSVAVLTNMATPDVLAGLRRLVESELITACATSRFPNEREFTMRHALVREAAYGLLRETDRAVAHRAAAAWLERRGENEPIVLAQHLQRAGEGERAALHYYRAAQAANQAGDSELVLKYARLGIEAGAVGTTRTDLLSLILEMRMWRLHHGDETAHLARELLESARPGSVAWTRGLLTRTTELALAGRLEEAWSLVDPAGGILIEQDATSLYCLSLAAVIWVASFWGLNDRVDAVTRRLGATMARQPPEERLSYAWYELAHAGTAISRGSASLWSTVVRVRQLAALARQAGSARVERVAMVWFGYGLVCVGSAEEGRDVLLACSRADEDAASGSSSRSLALAWAALHLEDLEAAAQHAQRLVDLGRRRAFAMDEARGHWVWSEVHRRRQDHAAAEAATACGLGLAIPVDRPALLASRAASHLAVGRGAEALVVAKEAMALYRTTQMCSHFFGIALLHVVYIEALLACDQKAHARAAATVARDWLFAIADAIDDDAYRERFLRDVPEHRRIQELVG